MKRYIDADVLIDDLVNNRGFYPAMVASAIKNTPTADVEEVVHGEWLIEHTQVRFASYYRGTCSVCGETVARVHEEDIRALKYCHCGAKMNAERSENGTEENSTPRG